MQITEAQLRTLGPHGKETIIAGVVAHAADTLTIYDIATPLRLAHFWAQAAHECDGFATMEEYASGHLYEGRHDLGNTHPGDGERYKGRGIFQITGRANYAAYGAKLKLDLEGNPQLAADPETALRIACEYWRDHSLSAFADRDDLYTITRRINGGLNGLVDRRAKLTVAKKLWAS